MSDDHLTEAMQKPGDVYATPKAVLEDEALSAEDKRKVLENWANEMKYLLESTDQNMPPLQDDKDPEELLQDILAALETLEGAPA